MRVLVIDESVKARAAQVRQFALDHRENLHDLMRRMNQPDAAPGNYPNFVLQIFDGYRTVMTLEQQPEPLSWCWHISMSVSSPNPAVDNPALPNPYAVNEILKALGVASSFQESAKLLTDDGVLQLWIKYVEQPQPAHP